MRHINNFEELEKHMAKNSYFIHLAAILGTLETIKTYDVEGFLPESPEKSGSLSRTQFSVGQRELEASSNKFQFLTLTKAVGEPETYFE